MEPSNLINRRTALQTLLASGIVVAARAQSRPDSFAVYSDAPRLLLRPARLKLLKRESERKSLRWEQFQTLWTGNAQFPELGWVQALRYQISGDREAATRAIAWAVGPGEDVRQLALIFDWCEPLIQGSDKTQLVAKLQRAMADPKPVRTLDDARARLFAAIALSEAQPAASEKAVQRIFETFWIATFIPGLRNAAQIPNADAYALLEILHAFRDNLNFDLRETFPAWFKQYPLEHLMSLYPAPWPGSDNEYRIPADPKIDKSGPELRKATLSRAAELAMVAFDANAASSQFLQGWLLNDRFVMRGPLGIPYEFLWANPYQPGLSYYHVPLALHDEIGGQLYIRSSWEDDASWAGFFGGQLQVFRNGEVKLIDPKTAREAIDIEAAIIFFGRETKRFLVPREKGEDGKDLDFSVFIVGLQPKRAYHVEVDGEEMSEYRADPGGIIFLTEVVGGSGIRLDPVPALT